MDMFKSGVNNTPETLTAVGGGGEKCVISKLSACFVDGAEL